MLTRLLLLFFVIILPVYFYIILIITPIESVIKSIIDSQLFAVAFKIFFPIMMSVPWWLLIYFYRNKISNGIELWIKNNSLIPLRYIIFYGTNAVFASIFILLPIASPILLFIAFLSLAWWVVLSSKFAWKLGKFFLVLYAVIVFTCLLGFVVLITLLFYPAYLTIFTTLIDNWIANLSYLYSFAILLVNAITWSTFIWILELYFRKKPLDDFIDVSTFKNIIIALIIFVTLIFIWIYGLQNIINYFNIISIIFSAIIISIKIKVGAVGKNTSIIGVIAAAVFILSDILYRANLIALNLGLIMTAAIFYLTLLYSIAKAPEELII